MVKAVRLLVVDEEIIRGGVEAIRCNLLPSLAEQCESVTWVVPDHQIPFLSKLFPQPANFKIEGLLSPLSNWRRWVHAILRRVPLKAVAFARNYLERRLVTRRLRELSRKMGATHCLSTCVFGQPFPSLPLPIGGVIYDLNPVLPTTIKENIHSWARRASVSFASSDFTRDILIERCPERQMDILTVPMAAPLGEIRNGSEPEVFTFFYPAVANPHKDHHTLFKACAILIERGRAFRVIIAGGGTLALCGDTVLPNSDLEAARQLVNGSPKLQETIVFSGQLSTSAALDVYAGSSAVVLPSRYEGFGMPLVESLRQGLPVICSDIPPFREQLALYDAGGAARIFSPGDAEQLAEMMDQVLASRPPKRTNAEITRQMNRWTWRDASAKILESLTCRTTPK
jgi:glycosyltransferase involved in cell wall biosynthesis